MKYTIYFLLLFCCQSGYSQDSLKVLDALYSDFSIPDASAFSLLGINPSKITRPSSTKELASALVNAASSGKSISPGIAIEWAPMLTFDRRFIKNDSINRIYKDFEHYSKTFFQRNLQLSFATVQDSGGSKVALGLSFVIFDKSDPKNNKQYALNLIEKTTEALSKLSNLNDKRSAFATYKSSAFRNLGIDIVKDEAFYINGPCQSSDFDKHDLVLSKDSISKLFIDKLKLPKGDIKEKTVDTLVTKFIDTYIIYQRIVNSDRTALLKIIQTEQEKYKKDNWNASILKFGIGQIWNSYDNAWQNLQSKKLTAYGALALKIKKWGQVVVLGQGGYNYDTDSINLAQVTFGVRLLVGKNNLHGSLEFGDQYNAFKTSETRPEKDQNILRSTVGIEFKINEGLWIEFAIGVTGNSIDFQKKASMLSLANIKYTFKKEARFKL
jgi:hypothetical protein